MEDSLPNRIKGIVEYSNLSVRALGEKIGTKTPQALYELLKGNTKTLSKSIQDGILNAFPEINRAWLLTGEGEMLKERSSGKEIGGIYAVGINDKEVSQIDFVPVSAHATFIENLYLPDGENVKYPVVLSSSEKNDINLFKVFEVEGDSMSPSIANGALILAKEIPEKNWHYAEGVVIVVFSEFVVVKRIEKNDLLTNNLIVLSSDNERYGKLTVQLTDIRAIYKAKRILSSEII